MSAVLARTDPMVALAAAHTALDQLLGLES
jgi:hypothetical protein